MLPQSGKSVRRCITPQELLGRGKAPLFTEHLEEASGIVVKLSFGGLVNRHHGAVPPPLSVIHFSSFKMLRILCCVGLWTLFSPVTGQKLGSIVLADGGQG